MGQPDFSKAFPKRFITMSMQDKYMAVCFIYDGMHYQNLCREEGPNGTFNYSEKCLSSLPYNLPFIGFDSNSSINNERGLERYIQRPEAEFPDILSAISYYWVQILILCIVSALILNFAFSTLRQNSSRYLRFFNYLTGRNLFAQKQRSRHSAMPTVDEQGIISIRKISFNPKAVLGYGSKGTCVFKGSFEDSLDCAVKRVVSQYLNLADREVDFLRSLQHPNLVRYLATEEDAQFIYIALELAEFTLGDLIEKKRTYEIGLSAEELCRQSALGLQHLHLQNIVHRDIKPQNILISFPLRPNNERKVMISDFGLSKQLNNSDTGHTSSAMRYFDGTQGWMAPEIVNAKLNEDKTLSPTKSADIFSLGCVFYYIISDGKHPFGSVDKRQSNILGNMNVLDLFSFKNLNVSEERAVMATKLIQAMIRSSPEERPPINAILKYPFFWSSSDQLQFIQDVSDRIERIDRINKEEKEKKDERGEIDGKERKILGRVERNNQKIFGYGWFECLSQELQDDLRKNRKYRGKSLRDLLRAIRNKRHHYRELPEPVKTSLGNVPDGFLNYFSSRFPEMLPHVYEAMQECKTENEFKTYYEQLENFNFT